MWANPLTETMWSSALPPPFHSTLTISTSPREGVQSLHYELSPGSSPRGGARLKPILKQQSRLVRFSDPESPSPGEEGEEGQQEQHQGQSSDQEEQASPGAQRPVAQQPLWWPGADHQASGGSPPAALYYQGYPPEAYGGQYASYHGGQQQSYSYNPGQQQSYNPDQQPLRQGASRFQAPAAPAQPPRHSPAPAPAAAEGVPSGESQPSLHFPARRHEPGLASSTPLTSTTCSAETQTGVWAAPERAQRGSVRAPAPAAEQPPACQASIPRAAPDASIGSELRAATAHPAHSPITRQHAPAAAPATGRPPQSQASQPLPALLPAEQPPEAQAPPPVDPRPQPQPQAPPPAYPQPVRQGGGGGVAVSDALPARAAARELRSLVGSAQRMQAALAEGQAAFQRQAEAVERAVLQRVFYVSLTPSI